MTGRIRRMLDEVVEKRARGNPTIRSITVTKLVLKGIDPDKFNASSPDDAEVIARVRQIAAEFGVSL